MSTPNGYLDVPIYLQVEPRERRYDPATGRYDGTARSAAVVATTVKPPGKPKGGVIVVKITLRIPTAAFDPLRPEAVVVIPTELTDPHPIEVEATDPTDGGAS